LSGNFPIQGIHVRPRPKLAPHHPSAVGTAESELIQRLRYGDESALRSVMGQHWNELQRYATGILQDPDLAADVAQETFVRLWTHRESWGVEGSLRALVLQIGRRAAMDELKKAGRRRAFLNRCDPRPVATPTEVLEETELEQAVDRALAGLPDRTRLIFLMARLEGLSHKDIAAALGLSPQTVSNQMTAALVSLRASLRPFLAWSAADRR